MSRERDFPKACRALATAMLIWIPGLCLASTDAEIVFLSGKGERKDSEPAPWAPAAVKHLVKPNGFVGSSRVDLQACKLEYSIVSPK